jgi:hypothetical protein
MTLHARLLKSGVEDGASCIECHATSEFKHDIRADEDPLASTHVDQLGKTCGASGCHGFANNPNNLSVNQTARHDVAFLNTLNFDDVLLMQQFSSWWQRALLIFMPLIIFMAVGSLIWTFFGKKKKQVSAIIGADSFDKKMLNIKRKATKNPKKKLETKAPKQPPKSGGSESADNKPEDSNPLKEDEDKQ